VGGVDRVTREREYITNGHRDGKAPFSLKKSPPLRFPRCNIVTRDVDQEREVVEEGEGEEEG